MYFFYNKLGKEKCRNMGLIVKNTSFDETDDDIEIGSEVVIKDTGITGVVVMKIGSIYQVKIGNAVSSYTYDEIEIRK